MSETRNVITVLANGPLLCRGSIEIYDSEGDLVAEETEVALCRCGASKTKPFCDGRHQAVGFEDPGVFDDPKREELESTDEPLRITCRDNGMLVVKGPMIIRSEDGAAETTRNKAALCRCGGSEKKPFCDVSHKKIGFVSD